MSRHRHVTRILTRFSRFTSFISPTKSINTKLLQFVPSTTPQKKTSLCHVISWSSYDCDEFLFWDRASWDVAVFLPRLVIRCETPGQAGVSLGPGHWSRRPFVMTRLSHQWPLIGHRLMYRSYDWCKWEKVPHIIPIHILCIFKFSCMGKSLWSSTSSLYSLVLVVVNWLNLVLNLN